MHNSPNLIRPNFHRLPITTVNHCYSTVIFESITHWYPSLWSRTLKNAEPLKPPLCNRNTLIRSRTNHCKKYHRTLQLFLADSGTRRFFWKKWDLEGLQLYILLEFEYRFLISFCYFLVPINSLLTNTLIT